MPCFGTRLLLLQVVLVALTLSSGSSSSAIHIAPASSSSSAAAAAIGLSRRRACFLGRAPLLLFTGPHRDHGTTSPSAPLAPAAGHPRPLAATATAAGEGACSGPFLLSESRVGGGHHPDDHSRTFYTADPATGQLQAAEQQPVGTMPSAVAEATVETAAGPRRRSMLANPVRWVRQLLRSVFLPVGWPGSVAPEYLRFQAWNVIQDLSTYLRGILATKVNA
jgi:hypothetical protein